MPDKKTANSNIKKWFIFAVKYLLPTSTLIIVLMRDSIDKFFVFGVSFSFFIILVNFILDTATRLLKINESHQKNMGKIIGVTESILYIFKNKDGKN
jgi:hypothetical protein